MLNNVIKMKRQKKKKKKIWEIVSNYGAGF